MDKLASRNTENEPLREMEGGALHETKIGLLAKAFRERPHVIRRMHPPPRPSTESLA